MLLKDKVALIAGAATGFGRTAAFKFAREGARVIIADKNREDGEKAAAGIRTEGNEAVFIAVDLTSIREIENMVKSAAEAYGRLDIFWHNAGASSPGHIELIEEEGFDKEIAVGLRAAVFGTKYMISVMKKAGGGSILYTSSMVGLRPTAYNPQYSLTHGIEKAAIIMLMRCVTEPLARYNIRVNCICPGPVATERWKTNVGRQARLMGKEPEELFKSMAQRLPIGRVISEEEIAEAAAFLVSDKASGVTGAAFPVDGGFSAV